MSSASRSIIPAALLLLGIVAMPARAQDNKSHAPDVSGEMQSLKRRVEDLEKSNQSLESQNRELMKLLAEIKARLDENSAAGPSTSPQIKPTHASLKSLESAPDPAAVSRTSEPRTTHEKATPPEPPAAQSDSVRWRELIAGENRLKFYGSLRLDLIYDSRRPDNPQSPLFIPPRSGLVPNLFPARHENFTMHPRLTAFGVDYEGAQITALGDGKLSGKLEIDFQNGGAEFAPAVRIQQAYLRMSWDQLFMLGGQTWDTFSPLRPTVNDDSLMFNAGNPGLRRPQLLIGYDQSTDAGGFSAVGGIGLTGAVDAADRDFDGAPDGEASGRPHWQGRVGYSYPFLGQMASVGLSGAYGFLRNRVGSAHARIANIDFTIPMASFLTLRGEGYLGKNMSDFGGAPLFFLQPTNQVHGRGGWSEVIIRPNSFWSGHLGFTTDDPVDSDFSSLGLNAITRNRAFYVGNRIRPGEGLTIGLDYLRWRTDFQGLSHSLDNRVNLFFKYSF